MDGPLYRLELMGVMDRWRLQCVARADSVRSKAIGKHFHFGKMVSLFGRAAIEFFCACVQRNMDPKSLLI